MKRFSRLSTISSVGLQLYQRNKKDDAFVTGMDKVYKQMLTELDAIGVKPIEALGKEFDPDLHNAVMQVESEEYEPGTVAQELQKVTPTRTMWSATVWSL